MANIAYVRVSTREQNEERQLEALQKYNIDKWYTEKVSGKNTNRPELQKMLDYIREGDAVYIHDFSRLARSTQDLLKLVETFKEKGVTLVSNKEAIDTSTATGKLMLTMIAAINDFERENLLERQAEGIEIAKREGKFQKPQVQDISDKQLKNLYEQYRKGKMTKRAIADTLNISRPTLDRLLRSKGLEQAPKKKTA